MATNGSHNGNGKLAIKNTLLEGVASLGVAELASIVAGLGVVAVADTVAPSLVKGTTKVIAKTVINPYLDYIEGMLNRYCRLEECKTNAEIPRDKRAEQYARAVTLFAPSFAASVSTKLAARRVMNDLIGINDDKVPGAKWWQVWKLTKNELGIVLPDEGCHLGSFLLLNMNKTAAAAGDETIKIVSNIFQKVGFSKSKADEMSQYGIIWELPNVIGWVAGLAGVAGKHYGLWDKEWHKKTYGERIKTQSSQHSNGHHKN